MSSEKEASPIETMRHSAAHLLAAALQRLYPGTQFGVGPVVENGFYYDVLTSTPISTDDFGKIEKEMERIKKENLSFEREELPLGRAKEIMASLGQGFKVQLLEDIEKHGTTRIGEEESAVSGMGENAIVSLYRTGDFVDLCRGPHVSSTRDIGVFKLKSVAGAYWRGDEKNPMLTRIYGYAFQTKDELAAHLTLLEEAEKRDHRKLGRELELFTIIDEIGPGLPLFYPKGALLRRLVENLVIEMQEKRGYVPIWIPHITKEPLYRISGHLDKYDAMYPPMVLDEDRYYLKPMNCPHFMMLYNTLPHSYRDLPVRYTCTTTNYRYEKSGELSGLTRVRALTQDDCHVFCAPDQIEGEIALMLDMIKDVYAVFGLTDFRVTVSVHDPQNREKYIGTDEYWETAEAALKRVVAEKGMPVEVAVGEAAFYGPKLDFMFKDAIGREWQLSTIQLDYNLPQRFSCEYAAADGTKQRPIVIHRAILGSTERFLGIIIEHFAGAFPFWLSPVQAAIVPVGLSHLESSRKLALRLQENGIRVEVDESNETVGYKIRKAEKSKVPYMIVIGDKESDLQTIALRARGSKEIKDVKLEECIAHFLDELHQTLKR